MPVIQPNNEPVRLEVNDLEFHDLLGDQFPHRLQSVVLPIIILRDGLVNLRGTAFSVGSNLALTAHHVLTQQDTNIEEAALLHVVPGPGPGQAHATLLQIEDVTAHPGSTDVSVLRLRVPPEGEHNPLPLQPMRLGMAPPHPGEPVAILGYRHDGPLGSVDEVLQLRPRLILSEGTVTTHSPGGYVVCKGPCFQIEAHTEGQMSGGPVLASAGDGSDLAVVRGVLSTGMNVPGGQPPVSTASMTFTMLALAPTVNRGTFEEPTYLYDLALNGKIPVVDLELVDWDLSDPAQPRIGMHPSDSTPTP